VHRSVNSLDPNRSFKAAVANVSFLDHKAVVQQRSSVNHHLRRQAIARSKAGHQSLVGPTRQHLFDRIRLSDRVVHCSLMCLSHPIVASGRADIIRMANRTALYHNGPVA
jgi:hypothetical protein